MRVLRFSVGLVAALVAHLVLVAVAPRLALVIDPFLLLIVFNARDGRIVAAVIGGTIAGLAEDTVSNGLFGLYGVAGTVVGYVAARAAQFLSQERRRFVAIFFSLAAVLQQIVIQLLFVSLAIERPLPALGVLAIRVIVIAAVGTGLNAGWERLSHLLADRREQRRQRLSVEFRG